MKITHEQLSAANCETDIFQGSRKFSLGTFYFWCRIQILVVENFSKVPKSSHWEPSICGAGSLNSAKVLQKVPRELKSSPTLQFSSAPLQLFLIILGVFRETRNENRNLVSTIPAGNMFVQLRVVYRITI